MNQADNKTYERLHTIKCDYGISDYYKYFSKNFNKPDNFVNRTLYTKILKDY